MTVDVLLLKLVQAQDRVEEASGEVAVLIAALGGHLNGQLLPGPLQEELDRILGEHIV